MLVWREGWSGQGAIDWDRGERPRRLGDMRWGIESMQVLRQRLEGRARLERRNNRSDTSESDDDESEVQHLHGTEVEHLELASLRAITVTRAEPRRILQLGLGEAAGEDRIRESRDMIARSEHTLTTVEALVRRAREAVNRIIGEDHTRAGGLVGRARRVLDRLFDQDSITTSDGEDSDYVDDDDDEDTDGLFDSGYSEDEDSEMDDFGW
ncbi:hypothetical protein EJ08DRAFT_702622 [Tothia fuscella]|uniref:Uncharacterized protein n=1 Tax=Tothia fuscella TaxID=1048955 RepID=A0A9P4NGD7_9PEZI|nr:hypothetical protein EJ08DRAFT_702622 [Tothia fuscella]